MQSRNSDDFYTTEAGQTVVNCLQSLWKSEENSPTNSLCSSPTADSHSHAQERISGEATTASSADYWVDTSLFSVSNQSSRATVHSTWSTIASDHNNACTTQVSEYCTSKVSEVTTAHTALQGCRRHSSVLYNESHTPQCSSTFSSAIAPPNKSNGGNESQATSDVDK